MNVSNADAKTEQEIKSAVRELYSKVAEGTSSCCGGGDPKMLTGEECVKRIGYDQEAVEHLPSSVTESNAGCGNPLHFAGLVPGETVLDLGSGAGLDCFLAATEVGNKGRVIGLDMTDAMLEKAEINRRKLDMDNVEFTTGEMEFMPVENMSVDVIISNCVLNLSPDKNAVFREAHRVLRPGGRIVVSDVLREEGLELEGSLEEWGECIAGAITEKEYLAGLQQAGFQDAEILTRTPYLREGLTSTTVKAVKPFPD